MRSRTRSRCSKTASPNPGTVNERRFVEQRRFCRTRTAARPCRAGAVHLGIAGRTGRAGPGHALRRARWWQAPAATAGAGCLRGGSRAMQPRSPARGLCGGADPRLFAGARRHALHGQRRAAPWQAHGACAFGEAQASAGRRCACRRWPSNCWCRTMAQWLPALSATLCRQLALAAGATGMAGGQAVDLASVGLSLDQPRSKPCTGSRPAPCCRPA